MTESGPRTLIETVEVRCSTDEIQDNHNNREHSNIEACMSVHWRAQCLSAVQISDALCGDADELSQHGAKLWTLPIHLKDVTVLLFLSCGEEKIWICGRRGFCSCCIYCPVQSMTSTWFIFGSAGGSRRSSSWGCLPNRVLYMSRRLGLLAQCRTVSYLFRRGWTWSRARGLRRQGRGHGSAAGPQRIWITRDRSLCGHRGWTQTAGLSCSRYLKAFVFSLF